MSLVIIVLLLAVPLVVIIASSLRGNDPRSASSSHATYDPPPYPEPAQAASGTKNIRVVDAFVRQDITAPASELQSFERVLAAFAPHARSNSPPEASPLKDENALRLIRKAKELISKQTELSDAWYWTNIRMIVAELGVTIPFEVTQDPTGEFAGQSTFFAYAHSVRPNLLVWPERIEQESDTVIASLLVHEATHVFIDRRTAEFAGYTPAEYNLVMRTCSKELQYFWGFAQEALAFYNQSLWTLAYPASAESPIQTNMKPMVASVEEYVNGKPHAFARKIDSYANKGVAKKLATISAGKLCPQRLPVIIRGPNRGKYFSLHIGRKIVLPLFNALDNP